MNNKSCTDVEVHHIARHLMNGHFVFISAVVVDKKLKFAFHTKLSPLQMLFFEEYHLQGRQFGIKQKREINQMMYIRKTRNDVFFVQFH